MDFDHLEASFSRTGQYEAPGTVWMLDPICPCIDEVTMSQLEGAMGMWTEEAYLRSSDHVPSRRLSFDVPLPVKVVDAKVAQRLEPGKPGVCVTEPLTVLAGRAVVITWYSAMSEALQQSNHDRVWYLFNAALSVPIKMRVLPDDDASQIASLNFSETMFSVHAASGADSFWRVSQKACRLAGVVESFAKNEAKGKMETRIKSYGLTFKGKAFSDAHVVALRGLQPFVLDHACASAFSLAEVYYQELREPTLLMRIGYACSARGGSDAKAKEYFVFAMNSLRVARLTGDIPDDDKLSVSRVVGREKKTPAMIHFLFKKKELVEFIFHEAQLLDETMAGNASMYRTPLSLLQKFAASGAQGLVASYRKHESGKVEGMEANFACQVAEHREMQDAKTQAMIDFVWLVWSGTLDAEVEQLTMEEFQQTAAASAGFQWCTYLNESTLELGAKYRAFVAACSTGPIPHGDDQDRNRGMIPLMGMSELGDEQKQELAKVQEHLKQIRRNKVKFGVLPVVSGASGAEYTWAQLQSAWEKLGLGHQFGRKKGDVRALVVSAELFPPNVAQQGAKAKLSDPMVTDENKFKRVLEFMATKRGEGRRPHYLRWQGQGEPPRH